MAASGATREYGLDDAIRAWAGTYDGLHVGEVNRRVRGFAAMVRSIAKGSPVTPERYASEAGLPVERVPSLFRDLSTVGVQLDADGNLIGAALTSVPTPHRLRVRDKTLYAWCALDALFLPGLLGETAEVWSVCPVSGDEIHLTVSPRLEAHVTPHEAVITVVLPGIDASIEQTGPASPT